MSPLEEYVRVDVCVLSQRCFGGGRELKRGERHRRVRVLRPSAPRAAQSGTSPRSDTVSPSSRSSGRARERIRRLPPPARRRFLKLKARTQCCSHCLSFSKEH